MRRSTVRALASYLRKSLVGGLALVALLLLALISSPPAAFSQSAYSEGRPQNFRYDPEAGPQYDRRKDPERIALEEREAKLAGALGQLKDSEYDLAKKIDSLQKQQDEVRDGIKQVQHELNRVQLQLMH